MERRSSMTRTRRWLAFVALALAAIAPVATATTSAPGSPKRLQAIVSRGCAEWACGTNHNQVQL